MDVKFGGSRMTLKLNYSLWSTSYIYHEMHLMKQCRDSFQSISSGKSELHLYQQQSLTEQLNMLENGKNFWLTRTKRLYDTQQVCLTWPALIILHIMWMKSWSSLRLYKTGIANSTLLEEKMVAINWQHTNCSRNHSSSRTTFYKTNIE